MHFAIMTCCLGCQFPALLLAQTSDGHTPSSTAPVVIVHGAWGGAHHWRAVAGELAGKYTGTIRRASLTGLGERAHLASPSVNLQTHIQDVVNLIEFDDLDSVILIGHSYGGVVISGVADAIPKRIRKLIYLDAHLLNHGEAYLTRHPDEQAKLTKRANEAGDGYLIPVDWKNAMRDVPHPLATLTQPLMLTNTASEDIPSTYWLFADGGPAEGDKRFRYYQRAEKRGWPVRVFRWGHNPQRHRPADVVAELLTEF